MIALRLARLLDGGLRALDLVFVWLAAACLGVALAGNIFNLLLRNLVGRSLAPVFAWTMVLFVWMVFLAFFPVYRRRIDIAMNMILSRLPRLAQAAMRLAIDALGIAIMLVMVAQLPLILEQQVGNIEFVGMQRYVLSLPLIASCGLIALNFLADALFALGGQAPDEGVAASLP